jgi:RHS repeat-associated protein
LAGSYADKTGLLYLINRYYDPTIGQFANVDPQVAVTGQPYAYTGDNPLNAVDPLGLICILGTNPGGGCRGATEVKNVVNIAGMAVNTAIQATPVGLAASAASKWTGLTIGGCIGGSYFGGPAVTANLCYAVTPSGQSGFTFSAGLGGGGPLGVNALVGPFASNAQTLSDLGGGFGYAEGTAGEGPYSAGVTGAIGQNMCGRTIWSAEAGWAPGLRLPIPAPFTFGGGGTYTWTFGQIG